MSQKLNVSFQKKIFDYAFPILQELSQTITKFTSDNINGIKKSIHISTKNLESKNLEKNENEKGQRSLLGVRNESDEWIINLNIGVIMQINAVKYDDMSYFDDFNFEISKNKLLEKVKCFYINIHTVHVFGFIIIMI